MKTHLPALSRILRLASRIVAVAALAGCVGCASTLDEGQLAAFEAMRGPVTAFSRNGVVCIPTSLGNAVGGLVGAPMALLVYPFVWPATLFTSDDDYLFQVYGTTFWAPVLLGGAATGGIFLPPALLLDESPCDFGVGGFEPDEGGYEEQEE